MSEFDKESLANLLQFCLVLVLYHASNVIAALSIVCTFQIVHLATGLNVLYSM